MEQKSGFRFPGEWEPMDHVMIDWSMAEDFSECPVAGYNAQDVMVEIIGHLLTVVKVRINCSGGSLSHAKKKLTGAGIDIAKITFTEIETNLSWPRDYGADILIDDQGNQRLIDFGWDTYGSRSIEPSPTDIAVNFAREHAKLCGCTDVVDSGLVSEGGDKEFNGNGVLMTTLYTEVESRNPQFTKEEIEAKFKELFNLKKVIWMPCVSWEDQSHLDGVYDVTPEGENVYRAGAANGHIDEICRFVAENEVVLPEVDEEELEHSMAARIQKDRIQQIYDVLKDETDAQGRPLVIHRLPSPSPIYVTAKEGDNTHGYWNITLEFEADMQGRDTLRDGSPIPRGDIKMIAAMSYCNFLVVNGLVLAQKYWREGMPLKMKEKDERAAQVLQDIYPDYKVVPIDTYALNLMGGGIHCMTKNVPLATKG